MRALCGAIIAAGSMIGLGLVCIAIGNRYVRYDYLDANGHPQWVRFRDIDTSLMFGLVFLACSALVGLGIAFVGLAYHHHRRHHEFLLAQERRGQDRVLQVPGTMP